jgi:hypothetical protein
MAFVTENPERIPAVDATFHRAFCRCDGAMTCQPVAAVK